MTAPAAGRRTAAPRALVTGTYAGPASRLAAIALDAWFVILSFTLGVSLGAYLIELFTPLEPDPSGSEGPWWLLGLIVWTGIYGIATTGSVARTPGKAVVGLRIVRRDGAPLGPRRAFTRVLAFPLTLCTFGIGFVGLFVGREARALHDVIAGTAVVYDWGERPAELPTPITRWMVREGVAEEEPIDTTATVEVTP